MNPSQPTVLIVEDNQLIRELFHRILSFNHYRVLLAADAPSGIALALRERPALVLMDIHLPGMDGLTAVQELRAQPTLRGLPIIVVSGYVTQEYREQAASLGCLDFIAKPVPALVLLEAVKKALGQGPGAGGA